MPVNLKLCLTIYLRKNRNVRFSKLDFYCYTGDLFFQSISCHLHDHDVVWPERVSATLDIVHSWALILMAKYYPYLLFLSLFYSIRTLCSCCLLCEIKIWIELNWTESIRQVIHRVPLCYLPLCNVLLAVCSFLLMITTMTNGITTAHEGSKEPGGIEDATMPVLTDCTWTVRILLMPTESTGRRLEATAIH